VQDQGLLSWTAAHAIAVPAERSLLCLSRQKIWREESIFILTLQKMQTEKLTDLPVISQGLHKHAGS